MEEILDLASKLGAAIANHKRYKSFRETEEQLKRDSLAKEASEVNERIEAKITIKRN